MKCQPGSITLPNNSALARYLRVKLASGYLVAAGAAEEEIGTLESRVFATDTVGSVLPRTAEGSRWGVAAGAIAQFATIYRAAAGKVNDVANGRPYGIALQAALADNDEIEFLPLGAEAAPMFVEAHTADDTLLAAEMYGSIHTSVGAAGTVVLTLPAAVVGMHAMFRVGAAQELRLDPNGTETIALPSTGVQGAAGKYLTANADGETVHLVCDKAGQWSVYGFTGTWTAEV